MPNFAGKGSPSIAEALAEALRRKNNYDPLTTKPQEAQPEGLDLVKELVAGFTPGVGTAQALRDYKRADASGNTLDKILSALSLIPVAGGVAKAGLLVPIMAGRNKVPKIAADLEKRAASAAQMEAAGAHPDQIWKDLQVSPVARTRSDLHSTDGRYAHEISTTPGEDLISPYAAMAEREKIELLRDKYFPAKDHDVVEKIVDRWALENEPSLAPKASSRRWHLNPVDDELQRQRTREQLDAAPGGQRILEALGDLRNNIAPLPVKGTVGSELSFDNLAAQYPELANMGFEAFQDMSKGLGEFGVYSPSTNTARIHPGSIFASEARGFDPTSTAIHEVGHGVQNAFGAPSGYAPQAALPAAQKEMIRKISEMLRTSPDMDLREMSRAILNNVDQTPQTQYRNIFGEADARNMAARELLTPKQRSTQSPTSTLDVNLEDLLDWRTQYYLREVTNPATQFGNEPTHVQAGALVNALRRDGVIK